MVLERKQSTKHLGNVYNHLQQHSTNVVSEYQMDMSVKVSLPINLYTYTLGVSAPVSQQFNRQMRLIYRHQWGDHFQVVPALLCQHPSQSLIGGFWIKFTSVHSVSCTLIDLSQWQMEQNALFHGFTVFHLRKLIFLLSKIRVDHPYF